MLDPDAQQIIEDLRWLGLTYDEGPCKEGQYSPYFQSKRSHIYEQMRMRFQDKKAIYRCFCTEEELAHKRERQILLKLPSRYDRTCTFLSEEKIAVYLANKTPFIWRFKLDHDASVTITDMAHGNVTFELSNFSDFPISRQDGSFTFIFANFVDDYEMKITHIFRGSDHLSNTANQAALFQALESPLPIYWHMPILCNKEGKKLSKRDFGFSLQDLRNAGFLAEAIINYVGIIGNSFEQEIMSLEELTQAFDFDAIHSSSSITYDVEKLTWVNKQWIGRSSTQDLVRRCRPLIIQKYPAAQTMSDNKLITLLEIIKLEMATLNDSVALLEFYFVAPTVHKADIDACISGDSQIIIKEIIQSSYHLFTHSQEWILYIKSAVREKQLSVKEMFWFLRLALMGRIHGPSIPELLEMLGAECAQKRIEHVLHLL